ncbi:MAG: dihydrofolate reductase [Pseudomonadales bacterium]|nr:dihydrofolate reductase [Pseudomonadales bacterium]
MKLALIAAVAANGVIGIQGKLPWHLPEDLKYFRQVTGNKPMIMGYRTFKSLPGLLPGRAHLVLSRQSHLSSDERIHYFTSLQAACEHASQGAEEAVVIGGAEIYALALPSVEKIYLTEIEQAFPGDTWFPAWDRTQFHETLRQRQLSTTGLPFSTVVYERNT